MRRSSAALVAVTLVLGACSASGAGQAVVRRSASPAPGRGFPFGDLRVVSGDRTALSLEVEIAETPEQISRGLMFVAQLADTRGMAFLMPGPSTLGFWMKNTLIPLDIAFWDADGRIVDILHMDPCKVPDAQCARYRPRDTYVGALEVNLGLLARSGVAVGDAVELERR